jgi:hypothetical protein
LYVKGKGNSKFHALDGTNVDAIKLANMREAKEFCEKYDQIENFTIYGNTNYINQVMEAYSKVTKADIQRVAKQYMDLTGRVVLYYLPKSAQPATE